MPFDTHVLFDSTDPRDQRLLDIIIADRRQRTSGVAIPLVQRVKNSRVGQIFVVPLANAITPGQSYSAQDLATILNGNGGTTWTPKRVAAKLNVLGRPEKRFGSRIFTRTSPGQYTLTAAMKTAILDPNN